MAWKRKKGRTVVAIVALVAVFAVVVLYAFLPRSQTPPQGRYYSVDSSLQPFQGSLPDEGKGVRPLSAVRDSKGLTSYFVSNEVLFTPANATDLKNFLAHSGGIIIGNTSLPAQRNASQRWLASKASVSYDVRIDPSSLGLQSFDSDATTLKVNDTATVSSSDGAKIIGFVLHERVAGEVISLNLVPEPSGAILHRTIDGKGKGGSDAMNWPEFNTTATLFGESWINVFKAWQFVGEDGFSYTPKVAVIDDGFWLDQNGHPTLGTDFPYNPIQYNFVASTYLAGGGSGINCSGNTPPTSNPLCLWHGNHAAEAATERLNNGWGTAGTGGQVAVPMLFKAMTYDEKNTAVETAIAWGADIISMSFGGSCDYWCRTFTDASGFISALSDARNAGLLMVAAAGNSGQDAQAQNLLPCFDTPVQLCVGAIDPANEEKPVSYSNWGSAVNIWAPTSLTVLNIALNGSSKGDLCKECYSGTSASTPYVAGIAAMVKAMNPALDGNAIASIITSTVGGTCATSYAGPCPPRVNAFSAVIKAAGGYNLPPEVYITSPKDGGQFTTGPGVLATSLSLKAWAYDIADSGTGGNLILGCQLQGGGWYGCDTNATMYSWSSSVDGAISLGGMVPADKLPHLPSSFPPSDSTVPQDTTTLDFGSSPPPGPRTISVTATNSHGVSATASVMVNLTVQHIPPLPSFVQPRTGGNVSAGIPYLIQAKAHEPGYLAVWIPCSRVIFEVQSGSGTVNVTSTPDSTFPQTGICDPTYTFSSPGPATITVIAFSQGGDVGSASAYILVVPPGSSFDFSLTQPYPNGSAVVPGGCVNFTFTISLVSGGPQYVGFSLVIPSNATGVTYAFNPNPVYLGINSPSFSVTLTVCTTSSTPLGTYSLAISAYGGGVTKTQTVTIFVQSIH
jgi:hypothetical protein